MKKIRYIAIGMILCSGIAAAAGLAFLMSGSASNHPEKDVETYMTEGDLYLDDGEYMKAVVSYQKALELDSSNADAYRGSAEAYSAVGYYVEEEEARNRLAELVPDDLDNLIGIVMVKMKQKQLGDAKAMAEELLEKYTDEELQALYHQMDVHVPVFNLSSGSYDSYQILELEEIPDNATVYYTVDGTEPNEFSNVYTDGIILSYPENVIRAVAKGFMGYDSDIVEYSYQITVPAEEIKWNNSSLEWKFRNELNKNWNEPLYNYELAQFRSLYILGEYNIDLEPMSEIAFYANGYERYNSYYSEWANCGVEAIADMPFLKTLSIGYQESVDLSYLSGLYYLEELSLLNDHITDIQSLGNLKQLKKLALGWNYITDVSALADLDNLESLGLWDNQVQDVGCLSGLNNLHYFDISGNQVKDISCIMSMPELSEIWISDNLINDFSPLDSCENITTLMLTGNPAGNYDMTKERADRLIKTDGNIERKAW